MKHEIHWVTGVEVDGDYRLRLHSEDRTVRSIDFRPVLRGELFGPLMDLDFFIKVRIDPETKTIVWPNGADFDPATLYHRPEVGPDLAARACEWEAVQTPWPASSAGRTVPVSRQRTPLTCFAGSARRARPT